MPQNSTSERPGHEGRTGDYFTPVPRGIPAGPEDVKKVKHLKKNVKSRIQLMTFCADYYGKWYYCFVIPSIILTTSVSVLAAAWPDGWHEEYNKCIIGTLSGIATMITSMLSLLKYQSKMDIYSQSAQQMDGLQSRASFILKFHLEGHVTRDFVQQFISETEKKMIEIRATAPPIPAWLEYKFETEKAFYFADNKDDDDKDKVNKSDSAQPLLDEPTSP